MGAKKLGQWAFGMSRMLIFIVLGFLLNVLNVRAGANWAHLADTTGQPAFPRTLWPENAEPERPNFQDSGGPVQLGTRFRASMDGYVTGVRFYKGAQNTGTHVGQLYAANGALLASKPFTNETVTGWQTVYFDVPVPISAGQDYITSYHTSSGFFAFSGNYFSVNFANPPLLAPSDSPSAPNGVYVYSSTPAFPSEGWEQANYWVDVIFETPEMPANGTVGVGIDTTVSRRFVEAMDGSTFTSETFQLRDSDGNLVPASVSYDAWLQTALLTPASQLKNASTYTVIIQNDVRDASGNPLPADISWNFTTEAGYPDSGPGGPILVITSTYDGFSRYYPEILRAEGLNAFLATDISGVTPGMLSNYDVVLLARMTLSDSQASMFASWVNQGGNLIAMRPDPRLASLLGVTPVADSPLSEGYLLVDTSSWPGAGIVGQTIQYHGDADRYTLSGAHLVATLYANASTPIANPAVTLNAVGANGGQAAMFAYDLARSVVLTHQGNPRWSGDNRDGIIPTRSADLFYGSKLGDPQPDWVNLDKVAIPQADEQQRLLANLILGMNLDRKPLPRFWYFPRDEKAVVVMTSDDHANNTSHNSMYDDRLDQMNSFDPPGCSVEDWECVRQSMYLSPGFTTSPAENAKIQAYVAQGHEFGVHVSTECADYTNAALNTFLTNQVGWFNSTFPFLPPPVSERTHCVPWSNYAAHLDVRRSHGIRLDTNFYYHPSSWVNDRPGLFTGSGLLMRFADVDGRVIDVYQGVTHMTDESGQTFPYTVDTLLDNALGPNGYYGAFLANMHSDSGAYLPANIAIVQAAQARSVPIVSARQMLTWLDGRENSSFGHFNWNGGILTFSISADSRARGLRAMLPAQGASGPLVSISRNGVQVSYRTETIKGITYAFFDGLSGDYQVSYVPDTTSPVISDIAAAVSPEGNAVITWNTDEFATSRVDYGTNPAALTLNTSQPALVTSHAVTLAGLTPNTTYYYRVISVDSTGNSATAPASPLTFTTPILPFIDTTSSDFLAGTLASCSLAESGNGEISLAPAIGEEFSSPSLPSGWSQQVWASGATVSIVDGQLVADGMGFYYNTSGFTPGRSLEFAATFSADDYQSIGFMGYPAWNTYWAFFGTSSSTSQVYASMSGGVNVPVGNLVGTKHRYRIDWVGNTFTFFVDGAQVYQHTVGYQFILRPGVIDDTVDGRPARIDWMRMSPYASSCAFTSRVLDAGQMVDWQSLTWAGTLPANTSVLFETRSGSTASPDAFWSDWQALDNSNITSPDGRYLQYRATLASSNAFVTPVVESVLMSYLPASGPASTPTPTGTATLTITSPPPTATPTPTGTATLTITSLPPTATPTLTGTATLTITSLPPTATPTPTGTATLTITSLPPTATPTPTGTATSTPIGTGWLSPSTNAAQTGGDNNGYELDAVYAYDDDALYAVDNNSGTGTGTSCTGSGKDKHRFFNFGINLPALAVIQGIEVRLDALVDSTANSPRICVQLSWNGGSSWTAAKATTTLNTVEQTYILGGPNDLWGRSWTLSQLSDANFRVRVINVASSTARDFSLDWIAIRITYR